MIALRRSWTTRLGIAAVLGLLNVGCDPAPQETTPQGSVPHAKASTPSIDAEHTVTILMLDGRPVQFPPARLRMDPQGTDLHAVLYSDDPPQAIHRGYDGNSFYLELTLEAARWDQLPGTLVRFGQESEEPTESPDGLFLNGRETQLQPQSATIDFAATEDPSTLRARLEGTFLAFQPDNDSQPPKRVKVTGQWPVRHSLEP